VWQGQPYRAKLAEAGLVAIEDAARYVEVGNGIAVVEHGSVAPTPSDRCQGGCGAGV
jgi:hypothetical protein